MPPANRHPEEDEQPWFTTTHWSVVLAAGQSASTQADASLAQLCRTYWQPLYGFVRGRGHSVHDAQDLTQGFFGRFLAKDYLKSVDRSKGKFRSFLLAAIKHYLSDERDRMQAQKRGGGVVHIGIDAVAAEKHFQDGLVQASDAETAFDRNWALAVLRAARAQLRDRYEKSGKLERFEILAPHLLSHKDLPQYSQVAQKLNMNEIAVKADILRMRKRFRDFLRSEVAHTVSGPEEIDDELRYLISIL